MRTSFRLINLPDLSTQASLGEDILKLIFDEESADVAFLVKGQMFYAHRQILKALRHVCQIEFPAWMMWSPTSLKLCSDTCMGKAFIQTIGR
jgi:hypothetical protein